MEVKVSVYGVQRVVCGVTEETTCQEVVIALAQALGQPGRYILREKFKDFERSMTPSERLLESLEKYGQQAREVQLTLLLNGPSFWEEERGRSKLGGRYQPCPPMRRKDAGARTRRGSASLSLHRRSLPPLSCLPQEAEKPAEDQKRQKRKSLTLMEEAWGWFESLGKGKVYNTACVKEGRKKNDKKNHNSVDISVCVEKDTSAPGCLMSKVRGEKPVKSDMDHQTTCCIGNRPRGKESKHSKKTQRSKSDDLISSRCAMSADEKNTLRETIIWQITCLQDLQVQITGIDKQIMELEEQQRARKEEQEVEQKIVEEEEEQIKYWENELKAEEVYEKDLQCQFLEMKERAGECKAKLEEYKSNMQRPNFSELQNVTDLEIGSKADKNAVNVMGSIRDLHQERCNSDGDVKMNRKSLPKDPSKPLHAVVPPNQSAGRRPTGPTELREWWTRWSEAQNSQTDSKRKVIHRSELTIYLSSSKV
ncbi:uncharacterized protein rassf11 [Genypterus blacodes]|uniref:uncharacterized protein rassf11 n=1 Tax=Genypterus blacodes TaxID=154954 RepID=UPI003F77255A